MCGYVFVYMYIYVYVYVYMYMYIYIYIYTYTYTLIHADDACFHKSLKKVCRASSPEQAPLASVASAQELQQNDRDNAAASTSAPNSLPHDLEVEYNEMDQGSPAATLARELGAIVALLHVELFLHFLDLVASL